MLAMWHRVMTRQISIYRNDKCELASPQHISEIRESLLRCQLRLRVDQVGEYVDQLKETPEEIDWKTIGCTIPPSNDIWLECVSKTQSGMLQTGAIISKRLSVLPNEFGSIVFGNSHGDAMCVFASTFAFNADGSCKSIRGANWFDRVALQAFAFLHCKNVKQIDITATHGPDAKFCRRQRVPSVVYKTLLIPGFTYEGRIVNNDGTLGEAAPDAADRRIHIVRGHFATYTADKPLFGRASTGVGKFWHPAHTRGNMAAGAVVKDYEVAPPPATNDDPNNPQA